MIIPTLIDARFWAISFTAGLLAVLLTGCDLMGISNEPDPNGPSLESVVQEPTREKIANVAVGVESGMRTDLNLYLTDVSMIGREVYRFSASEPRFTSELLGSGAAVLDNNTFYITRPWAERYRVIRNAEIMLEALDNAPDGLFTAEEIAGYRGFADTIIAYQLLLNANLVFENGIRVDVSAEELGPVVSYTNALGAIATRLNEGAAQLENAGTDFAFPLSEGFEGFDTPATFREFNRALAARVAVYQGDYQQALTVLDETFLDDEAPLDQGVYHVFSTAPGDLVNPWFINPQQSGNLIAAHPSFVEDIARDSEDAIIDARFDKVVAREETFEQVGLRSEWGFFVYASQVAPIPILRNGELLLIRAEASIQEDDFGTAVADLNTVRAAAGLPAYDGPETEEALLDEMLRQRRYELYGEGHRWIDVRRYDRLDELPIDRVDDTVWTQFPIPANENL